MPLAGLDSVNPRLMHQLKNCRDRTGSTVFLFRVEMVEIEPSGVGQGLAMDGQGIGEHG